MNDLNINFLNKYHNRSFSMVNEQTRTVTEVNKNILTEPEIELNISERLLNSISNNFFNFSYKFYLTNNYNKIDVSQYFRIKGELNKITVVKISSILFDSDIMIGEQNPNRSIKDINSKILFPYLIVEFNILGKTINSNFIDLSSFYLEWNSSNFKLRYDKINKLDEAMDRLGYRVKTNKNVDRATYEEFDSMSRIGIAGHFKKYF